MRTAKRYLLVEVEFVPPLFELVGELDFPHIQSISHEDLAVNTNVRSEHSPFDAFDRAPHAGMRDAVGEHAPRHNRRAIARESGGNSGCPTRDRPMCMHFAQGYPSDTLP